MESNAVITGVGLVTPLGHSAAETWDALIAGRSIPDHTRLTLDELAELSRVSRLGIHAGHEAMSHSGWSADLLKSSDTALILGTSKGAIEDWPTAGRIETSEGIAEIANDVARHFGFGSGPRLTLSAACASGLHALIRATMVIQRGEAKRALVIASEASVNPLFIASFKRLGILPPEGHGCRPFDKNRRGFLMSESAAAICLEARTDQNSGRALARVDRYAMGGDATHLTASDPNATMLRYALNSVIRENTMDLVHAHGTGTEMNDAIELSALEDTLHQAQPRMAGQPRPHLYSHKGALGHTLGTSGLLSIVLNTLSHHHNLIPGNVRTTDPLAMDHVICNSTPIERSIRRSIAIAAGFGGALAVVSLTRS